jgi:hypothetical protein
MYVQAASDVEVVDISTDDGVRNRWVVDMLKLWI